MRAQELVDERAENEARRRSTNSEKEEMVRTHGECSPRHSMPFQLLERGFTIRSTGTDG